MKARRLCSIAAMTLVAAILPAGSPALADPPKSLELGDAAPPLKVDKWIKGDAVEKFAEGNIYVVEFWATWCGPCRASIPHLTDLQKKYKDKKVTVIGVSVDSEKTREKVAPFVKDQGDKMQYIVALDKDNGTSKAYMDPFKAQGIPESFIVDAKGKLVWHGHPQMGLEEVLEAVVAGKSDVKELGEISGKVVKEFEKLLATVDEYFDVAREGKDQEKAADLGKTILAKGAKDADILNRFAWEVLTNDELKLHDKELALKAATAAVELTKGEDFAVLDTYARALFDNGKTKDAIEQQKKAIKLAGDNKDAVKDLTESLEKYEAGGDGKTEKEAGAAGAKDTAKGSKDAGEKGGKEAGDKGGKEKP